MIYVPFVLPRIRKVKTDYLFHQYLKKKYMRNNKKVISDRFFEEELKTGKRNIKLREMKRMLNKMNEKDV